MLFTYKTAALFVFSTRRKQDISSHVMQTFLAFISNIFKHKLVSANTYFIQ